jgi:feruloyl-CoA synthase
LRFDGRLAENFKLSSGTWVNVAELRLVALNVFSPYARDVVIAGHDRDFLTALVFPDLEACRALCDDLLEPMPDADQIVSSAGVREHFQRGLDTLATRPGGSSSRIVRIALESEPATLDNGELSAKGAISQANVLARRRDVVTELYEAVPTPRTLVGRSGSSASAARQI